MLLACCQFHLLAQLDCSSVEYTYTTFNETYLDLDTTQSISLTEGIVWDDPDLYFPIGFDFEYFSFTTSNLLVSGELLGAGVIGNPDALKSFGNAFLPAFADFTDLGYAEFDEGTENGISTISYLTEGEEGDRIMKLEWNNVGFYSEVSEGTANNYMNIQLWLYESDQSIEFRYGPSQINPDDFDTVFEGVPGPISGLLCSIPFAEGDIIGAVLAGDTSNPNISEISPEDDFPPALDGMPESGRVYRWERSIVSVEESNVQDTELAVYPNPFKDALNVTADSELQSIQISDMTGKVVLESALQCKSCQIPTADLASGIYLVRMKIGNQVISKKITKS